MELARRKDVPEELKWDLSLIYPTEAEMEADFAKAQKIADHLAAEYPGTLNDPARIVACLDEQEQMERILVLVGSYCSLAVEVDYYDTANQQRSDRVSTIEAQIASRLSFIESEILQADDAVLDAAIEQAVGCKHRLMDLRRQKPYQLAPETEKALAALQMSFDTPYEVYNMAKLADMQFPSFTVDGKEYPLGYSLFEDDYEYERDTAVRRAAFDAFSAKLRQYENVTASAYNALVRQEKSMADLRGYPSVFDYLLFDQKVTREMYDRQIDLITERLAPHMRRFARLLQKKYGLDEMTFADLKLSLDPDYDPRVTIPEAKDYVKKGLAVMGEDYVSMVEEAFDKRWIDFAKNQGKCTGGFCSSPYGRNSFILLSWNDRMSDVFTIAHELGHAGHFRHCNAKQSLSDTEVSTYLIEAPSTMNELLLAQYLLKTNDDPRFRRWVLSSMISNTYYHNFVTHLREAWYQREVYKLVDAGDSVNAEVLSDIFRKNLELFWGEGVKINDGAELTWMRQPHYYMGLYSYTYSAGLTVATEVARRIQREAPLNDTIDYIGSIIDEICKLTKEIDGIEA